MTNPLIEVMSGRDERAALQALMLKGSGSDAECTFLVQITLNIPGYPKRISGDGDALDLCRKKFIKSCAAPLRKEQNLCNGAGLSWTAAFLGDKEAALAAKRSALAIENSPGGMIFDIDIIRSDGAISRTGLGMPQRKCIICDDEAKICARLRVHSSEELRRSVKFFLKNFLIYP